jgi:hypothetical protein
MASNGNGGKGYFHKGALGSPYQLETYGNTGRDPGNAAYEKGPRIGPGALGRKVTMEVQKSGNGNGKRNGN